MSGFAAIIDAERPVGTRLPELTDFSALVAGFKRLPQPTEYVSGVHCAAAKLDGPSTVHYGVVRDDRTGSWLMAAGTVVDLTGVVSPDSGLAHLLEAYVARGLPALDEIDGQFALIIYDGVEESLSVITDGLGQFSIFYGSVGKRTYIASSSLAVAKQIESPPDVASVESFLRLGFLYGSRTLWQGVRRLNPGMLLKITPTSTTETQYWRPTVDEAISTLSLNDACDRALQMLTDTYRSMLQHERLVWADFSGGFDSRLTTMMLARQDIPFIAYSFGPEGHPDVTIPRQICEMMGWDYRHITLPDEWGADLYSWFARALEKSDGHLSALTTAIVLRQHAQKAPTSRVHILGLGGEDFRGYYYSGELFRIGRRQEVNLDRLFIRLFSHPVPTFALRQDLGPTVEQDMRSYIEWLFAPYAEHPNSVKLDVYNMSEHLTHGGAFMSTAAGIMRGLTPLSFKAPTNLALSLNYRLKLPRHQRFVRELQERLNPLVANVETTAGGPAVPMRMSNVRSFGPFWGDLLNNVSQRFSRRLLGRVITPFPKKAGYPRYPLPSWRDAWLTFARLERLLDPAHMHSAALYDTAGLHTLVAQAGQQGFQYGSFLDHMITVEMATRAVGTHIS
jgi:asparagine synthetase B (glutamine-hydrolysing)